MRSAKPKCELQLGGPCREFSPKVNPKFKCTEKIPNSDERVRFPVPVGTCDITSTNPGSRGDIARHAGAAGDAMSLETRATSSTIAQHPNCRPKALGTRLPSHIARLTYVERRARAHVQDMGALSESHQRLGHRSRPPHARRLHLPGRDGHIPLPPPRPSSPGQHNWSYRQTYAVNWWVACSTADGVNELQGPRRSHYRAFHRRPSGARVAA